MRSEPLNVFASYARKDKVHLLDLKEHLSAPIRNGTLNIWFDQDIPAGNEWRQEIFEHLESAEIVLLLVSPAYIASEFCMLEAERALERFREGRARVIPILIRPADWSSLPFADLQFLLDGKPVPEAGAARDFAFAQVARTLREIAAEIQQKGATPLLLQTLDDLAEPERLNEMALALAEHGGEPRVAIEMLDKALILCRQRVGENSEEVAVLLSNRGQAYQDVGDLTKAREDMELALATAEAHYGRRHPGVVQYRVNLGGILAELGENLEALDILEDAVTFLENSAETDRRPLERARIFLAEALGSLGEARRAEELLETVLKTQPPDFQITAAAHSALGRIAYCRGRRRKTMAHFEAALEVAKEALGSQHPFVGLCFHNLGLILRDLGDRRANDLLRRALDVLTERLGSDSPRARWTRVELDGVAVHSN